jgi:hypothetical protein
MHHQLGKGVVVVTVPNPHRLTRLGLCCFPRLVQSSHTAGVVRNVFLRVAFEKLVHSAGRCGRATREP